MKHTLPEIDPNGWIRSRGIKMPKDGLFVKGRVRGRLKREAYETGFTDGALSAVKSGDRVLELGSGLGFTTAHIARAYDLEALRCYDGHPGVIAYAAAMLATNGIFNADLMHGVLDKRRGRRAFYCVDPFLRSSLRPSSERTMQRITVPAVNAGQVFQHFRPTILLCDIEGSEVDVAEAAPLVMLDRALVRLNPDIIGDSGVARVFAAFAEAGLVYWPEVSVGTLVGFRKPAGRT